MTSTCHDPAWPSGSRVLLRLEIFWNHENHVFFDVKIYGEKGLNISSSNFLCQWFHWPISHEYCNHRSEVTWVEENQIRTLQELFDVLAWNKSSQSLDDSLRSNMTMIELQSTHRILVFLFILCLQCIHNQNTSAWTLAFSSESKNHTHP